jgi:hypothetical protein
VASALSNRFISCEQTHLEVFIIVTLSANDRIVLESQSRFSACLRVSEHRRQNGKIKRSHKDFFLVTAVDFLTA